MLQYKRHRQKAGIRWLIALIIAVLSLLAQLLANMMIAVFK
ncbi:hypothetical protein [Scytonema sp. PRP1]